MNKDFLEFLKVFSTLIIIICLAFFLVFMGLAIHHTGLAILQRLL